MTDGSGAPAERLRWRWTLGFDRHSHIFRDVLAVGNRQRSNLGESESEAPRFRRISMTDQHGFISVRQFHPDPYIRSRTAEGTLNAAIVHAEIRRSCEAYLDAFDEVYADDIEGAAKPWRNGFAERRECAHFFSAFWFPFMQWPSSVGCRYLFKKRPFLEMLSTRPILRGHWSWSGFPAKSAL